MSTASNSETPSWDDQHGWLAELAADDLTDGEGVRPTLVAFNTEGPLFLATLRPFTKGGHHDPLIEVGALAMAMGARRLSVSLLGRAWSTEDPIPPVLPGTGDLRQPVLVVHSVDTVVDPHRKRSTIWPIADDNTLGEPLSADDGSGWVVDALSVMASSQDSGLNLPDIVGQAARCEALGHELAWGEEGLRQLELAAAASEPWLAGEAA